MDFFAVGVFAAPGRRAKTMFAPTAAAFGGPQVDPTGCLQGMSRSLKDELSMGALRAAHQWIPTAPVVDASPARYAPAPLRQFRRRADKKAAGGRRRRLKF